jgi:hypothetical protein
LELGLKNTIEYNNQDITNTKVMKVTYDNGFNYELVNKNDCERVVKFDTVCEADSEQLYATNALDVGYKYNCKVDPNSARYNFFVLSYNDENGNIIFDKENAKSVNLIMDSNIRTGGEPVKEENPTDEQKGLVHWINNDSFLSSGGELTDAIKNSEYCQTYNLCLDPTFGPITAMDYLESVTSKWNNLDKITINTYTSIDASNNNYMGTSQLKKTYNIYARMPYYSEIKETGCDSSYPAVCPLWITDYLELYNTNDTAHINAIGISGYWLNTYTNVDFDGGYIIAADSGITSSGGGILEKNGVRPVITLDL